MGNSESIQSINEDACVRLRHDSIISVEESGRKFEIANRQNEPIVEIRVDGCLICGELKRCDYLFEVGAECHCAIYVELKGKDIKKAYEQIATSMEHLSERHKHAKRIGHIVSSRVPRAAPKVESLKKMMMREKRALLLVGTSKVSIRIDKAPYCK